MLTDSEAIIIARVFQDATELTITRKSEREFDLQIKGKAEYGFEAWLPLSMIRHITWTTAEIAMMTDYPQMVVNGDWSGVRDSGTEKIWAIVDKIIDEVKDTPQCRY